MAVKQRTASKKKHLQQKGSTKKQTVGTGGNLPWIILSLGLLFLVGVRLRLLGIPFERDEAGFAYIGKMMFEGKHLYTDLPDNKLPGLYFIYGLFTKLLGYSPQGVHSGLLLFNLGTVAFLFLLLRRMFDALTASIGAAIFCVMIASVDIFGFAAHATQLLLLAGMIGLWFLQKAIDTRNWWLFLLSGLFLGTTFIIKQQGAFFIVLGGVYLLLTEWQAKTRMVPILRNAFLFVAGAIIPFAAVVFYMQATGRSQEFWYWTWSASLAAEASTSSNKSQLFFESFGRVMRKQWLFWILAVIGIILSWTQGQSISRRLFLALFFILALLSVIPGYNFYPHYYVLVVPVVASAAAFAVTWFRSSWKFYTAILIFVAATVQAIGNQADYFFSDSHDQILVSVYGGNPFPEARVLGDYLRQQTKPGDKLLVLGSEPELLVYSNLESAMRHLYVYSMMNGDSNSVKFQNELLDALHKGPRFVAFTNIQPSWFFKDSPENKEFWRKMTDALTGTKRYKRIATADMFADGTDYHYGADAEKLNFKRSGQSMDIYELIQ